MFEARPGEVHVVQDVGIQFVVLQYLFVDGDSAALRMADLEARGVPSYALAASLDGRPVYQVYGFMSHA